MCFCSNPISDKIGQFCYYGIYFCSKKLLFLPFFVLDTNNRHDSRNNNQLQKSNQNGHIMLTKIRWQYEEKNLFFCHCLSFAVHPTIHRAQQIHKLIPTLSKKLKRDYYIIELEILLYILPNKNRITLTTAGIWRLSRITSEVSCACTTLHLSMLKFS